MSGAAYESMLDVCRWWLRLWWWGRGLPWFGEGLVGGLSRNLSGPEVIPLVRRECTRGFSKV